MTEIEWAIETNLVKNLEPSTKNSCPEEIVIVSSEAS